MTNEQGINFLWAPYFDDFSKWLSRQKESQDQLIDALARAGISQGLEDKLADGSRVRLTEIDPFSIYALILKYGDKRRADILEKLNNQVGFTKRPAPTDYYGVPSAQAQKAWLFSYAYERHEGDIPALWRLFQQAINGNIENSTFTRALNVKAVGATKLTQALFWVAPNSYFPIDSQTKPFLRSHGINPNFDDWEEYEQILQRVSRLELGSYPELSYQAWYDNHANDKPERETVIITNQPNRVPLNQILYGPPGTGKTYGTIRRAVAIIEDKSLAELKPERDKIVKERFDAYRKSGRIGMVTFHQSFGYEDFVEGIKPVMLDEEEEVAEVTYRIEDGILKQMAGEAESFKKLKAERDSSETEIVIDDEILAEAEFFKMSLGNINSPEDQDIFDYCLEHDCIAMGWGDDVDFSEVKDEKELKEKLQENGYRGENGYGYVLTAIKCLKFWMSDGDIVFISNGNRRVRAIAQISGDYYFDNTTPLPFSQFRKVKWLYQQVDIPVKLVYEKNFSQASIYQMWNNLVKREFFSKDKLKEEEDQSNNYVLIIDEINRANVSAVFGELITLLEADKRAGADNALSVDLPYSKSTFSVPSNLYLIGTMNTADRSVEALDTALRRRFSFTEVGPQPQLLADIELDGVDLVNMLRTINQRIELLLDKDHCIGHAYFMGIAAANDPWQALREVFAQKVLPLLEEYFFGATGKIQLVLGPAFCTKSEANQEDNPFATGAKFGGGEYDQREIYRTVDIMAMGEEKFREAIQSITA